jgi:hypothetical protein
MRKERKYHTAEEKVAILRRHLLDKGPRLSGKSTTTDNLLSLAARVFWERSLGLPGEGASRPSDRGEAEAGQVLGEESPDQGRSPGRTDEHIALRKKSWGALTKSWVPHDVRGSGRGFCPTQDFPSSPGLIALLSFSCKLAWRAPSLNRSRWSWADTCRSPCWHFPA